MVAVRRLVGRFFTNSTIHWENGVEATGRSLRGFSRPHRAGRSDLPTKPSIASLELSAVALNVNVPRESDG
jgi:hypothetical protein